MRIFISVCLFLLWGCSSSLPENPDGRLGTSFFPLKTGFYQLYEIEQREYKLNGEVVDSVYQMKHLVVDSFQNQNGDYTFFIHRYLKVQEEWAFLSTWSAIKRPVNVLLYEESTPYVKLAFPFALRKQWNGNASNTLDDEQYTIDSLQQVFEYKGRSFENTTTVLQANIDDNILFKDYRAEIYAENKGMVYKELEQLEYCSDPDCLGQLIIISGIVKKQILIESGFE